MKDLTVGNPQNVLIKFSLPLLGSVVFQQLYNIADSFVAGKFINSEALASISNGYEVTLIYLSFALGCNMGCSVVLGHIFGAKDYNNVKTCVTTAFVATSVVCLTLMALGFLFTPLILELIKTPPEVFADTLTYLNIYTAGLLFLFFYNIANAIFSALGDSKTPFFFLAISSTVNIFMDIWFVKSFNLGIRGIAWATYICQGASCILSMITVFVKVHKLPVTAKPAFFSWSILRKMVYVAIPSTLQQCFVSVGNMFIQVLVNGFGTAVMAGYGAAIKLNNFAIMTMATVGNGVSCFTSQNLGAKKVDRIPKCFYAGLRLSVGVAMVETLIYVFLRKQLIGLFDFENISGINFLLIVSPFFFSVAAKLNADGILRGAGAMPYFMATTFLDLILRVVLAFIFVKCFNWGYLGIWWAWPFGWTISSALSLSFYFAGVWKNTRLHSDL